MNTQAPTQHDILLAETGPATLTKVMGELDSLVASGETERFRPLPTGFSPLDEVMSGGIRRGELMIFGGQYGVGKTIFGLQVARNVVRNDPNAKAMVICYEHDRVHLLMRLLCLESAEMLNNQSALTLRQLSRMMTRSTDGVGLLHHLRNMPTYKPVVDVIESYAERLVLVKASGATSDIMRIGEWMKEAVPTDEAHHFLVVVDYLQKIPVNTSRLSPELEITTYLAQSLKEFAMSLNIPILAVAASDRDGLKSKRMRLNDLRGSSALQYEADIGIILSNKHKIVSREHLVYNLVSAEKMRNWVVFSIEKNRAGRNAIDLEFALDAAHFRFVTKGNFVRDRLIDEKVTLE
jgi:replicative DNA helicase